jgi:hypothetical protein
LLSQIGSPDTLRGTDKIYAATHRFLQEMGEWRGAYRNDRLWGEVPVALKRTITGEGPTITLNVVDDLSANIPKQVELRVRLDQWVREDVVRVSWDGTVLDALTIHYCAINDPHHISDVSGAAWLCFEMNMPISVGAHEVKVVLEERHPKVASDIVLTDVELVVRF